MATPPKGSRSGAKPRSPAMIAFGRPAPQRPMPAPVRGKARVAQVKAARTAQVGARAKGIGTIKPKATGRAAAYGQGRPKANPPKISLNGINANPLDLLPKNISVPVPQIELFRQIGNKLKKATGG